MGGGEILNKEEKPVEAPRVEDKSLETIVKGNPEKLDAAVKNNLSFRAAKELIEKQLEDKKIDTNETNKIFEYIQNNASMPEFNKFIHDNSSKIIEGIAAGLKDNNLSRENVSKTEAILSYMQASGALVSLPSSINAPLQANKINLLKEDMKDEKFYKNVVDAYINKKYKNEINDTGLIDSLKKNAKIDKGEIQKYFDAGLDMSKEGHFSSHALQALLSKDYSLLQTNKLNIPGLEKLEMEYKKGQLKEAMKKITDKGLSEYDFDEKEKNDVASDLSNQIDSIINTYKDEDIKLNYAHKEKINTSFKKEITHALNDRIAEENRGFLLQEFATKNNDTLQKAKFESMLKETSTKDINTLALVINSDKNKTILEDIRKKVQDKNAKSSEPVRAFNGAKIVSATNESGIKTIEESKDTTGLYTKQLGETVRTKSIESSKSSIKDSINSYIKNGNVQINVPAGSDNAVVFNQIKDFVKDPANGRGKVDFKLNQIAGIADVQIQSIETKEVPQKIHLELKELSANSIGDGAKINQLLSDADPRMKQLLSPDNKDYKIVGGKMYGSASKNYTTYKNETPFVFSGTKVNAVPPVNQAGDINVSNNPDLAYNRSASFADYVLSLPDKVKQGTTFDVSYGVNGPTRKELVSQLTEKNKKVPNEEEIKNAFKEWQYATLDLDVIKTETVTQEKTISLNNTETAVARGFQLSFKTEKIDPSGEGKSQLLRLGSRSSRGLYKGNRGSYACPVF
ncbi:MAG: hypothetical protein NTY80_01105 [candidate division SR1 bacterium]|nr:hypothetical protein [candidate division SR1 bacterium]